MANEVALYSHLGTSYKQPKNY